MQEITKGNLRFYSRHPTLDQVAHDIAHGISDPKTLALPVNIYVGTQKFRRTHLRRPGHHLGLQTEHFFDETGRQMWRRQKWFRTLRNAVMYDRILDLSTFNRPNYQWLPKPLLSKIDFGPFIFPKGSFAFTPCTIPKALFYGYVNDRRATLLNEIAPDLVDLAPLDTFGTALERAIQDHMAVLNIHFTDGIYTEYPRLLSAYLQGKAIISEKLGSDLHPGRHYVPLEHISQTDRYAAIFKNFDQDFAQRHTLDAYLQRHFADRP